MKKRRNILLAGILAVTMLGTAACGGSGSQGASEAAEGTAGGAASSGGGAAADAEGIGFPAKETITLVVPGKAGGGSDLGIRYYSEGLNRLYGLKTTVTNYDSNSS